MLKLIGDYLIHRAMRTPYTHLPGYMERYWLVPFAPNTPEKNGAVGVEALKFHKRPFGWLLQKLGIAVRVHHILRSDHDRALHDHPWRFVLVILRGGYYEVRPSFYTVKTGPLKGRRLAVGTTTQWIGPGRIVMRKHTDLHRLVLPPGQTAWTLFITFKWRHVWGFVPNLRTGLKVPYREYLGLDDPNPNAPKWKEIRDFFAMTPRRERREAFSPELFAEYGKPKTHVISEQEIRDYCAEQDRKMVEAPTTCDCHGIDLEDCDARRPA